MSSYHSAEGTGNNTCMSYIMNGSINAHRYKKIPLIACCAARVIKTIILLLFNYYVSASISHIIIL